MPREAMVGLATQIGAEPLETGTAISHEVEYAVEASRAVIEQCFKLVGLMLDVDGAGLVILDDESAWHLNSGGDPLKMLPNVEDDLGNRIASAPGSVSSFFNADTSSLEVESLGAAGRGMAFFAGAPLVDDNGDRFGALWIGQENNRILSREDERQIVQLAGLLAVELQCHLGREIAAAPPVQEDSTIVPTSEETITICSWSKRIREEGEWIDFEDFLQRRLGVGITHGISEEYLEQMNRELDRMAARQ